MEAPEAIRATFTTNSFASNPYMVIALGVILGTTLMFFGIIIGVPVILSMVLLFAGIGIPYGYGMGKVQYSLTQQGIEQNIRRFIPYAVKGKEEIRIITWDKISSFKTDTDKKRYGGDYEYIKIYLKTSPGEVWITDQQDKAGFQIFKDAFLLMVGDVNAQKVKAATATLQQQPVTVNYPSINEGHNRQQSGHLHPINENPLIRQRKSFYETFFAKALTLFFTLFTILLIWIISYQGMHFTNWFKLMFIVLPGTVYMLYRVFFSTPKNDDNQQRYQQ
jgi:hypothetical protein